MLSANEDRSSYLSQSSHFPPVSDIADCGKKIYSIKFQQNPLCVGPKPQYTCFFKKKRKEKKYFELQKMKTSKRLVLLLC